MKPLGKKLIAALAAVAIGVGVIQACYVQSPYNLCVPPGMTIYFVNSTPGWWYDQSTGASGLLLPVNFLSTQGASYGPGYQSAKSGSAHLVNQCNYNWVSVMLTAAFWDYGAYNSQNLPPPPLNLNNNPTFIRADEVWLPYGFQFGLYGWLPSMWSLPGGIYGPTGKMVPMDLPNWGSQATVEWWHDDATSMWQFPNWGHVYIVCCGQGPDDTSCGPDGGGGGE